MNLPDHRTLTARNVALGTWRPFVLPRIRWGSVFGWMSGWIPGVLVLWFGAWFIYTVLKWVLIGTFLLTAPLFVQLSVHLTEHRARREAARRITLPPLTFLPSAQNLSRFAMAWAESAC